MPDTITVSNSAELESALRNVTGGEIIELRDTGSSYVLDAYRWANPASDVTIRSADSAAPATFNYLRLDGAQNIVIEDVRFEATPAEVNSRPSGLKDINILNSENIVIRDSVMLGYGDGIGGLGTNGNSLANIRASSGIVLEGNTISNYFQGIGLTDVRNSRIFGNEIFAMQGDGIRMVMVENVTIDSNYIHDFLGSANSLNHDDMIQLWSVGATYASSGLKIVNNVLDSGQGAGSQSIFLRNEIAEGSDFEAWAYKDFVIENNYIANGHVHGISVGEVDGISIANNTLVRNETPMLTASGGTDGPVYTPTIVINKPAANAVLADNKMPGSINVGSNTGLTLNNNGSTAQGASVSPETLPSDPAPTAPGAPEVITVSNSAELVAALKSVTGGETIELVNTGEPYELRGNSWASVSDTVTITSADAADPARIKQVSVAEAGNWTFENLVFSATEAEVAERGVSNLWYTYDISFARSFDITIRNSEMTGYAEGVGLEDNQSSSGVVFARSANMTLENNVISNYWHGIRIADVEGLVIQGNEITQLQADGLRMSEVIGGHIDGNYFHDFLGSAYTLNHDDMIQVWSNDATKVLRDLAIVNNIFDAGEGPATQTILIQNQMASANGMEDWAYTNIEIANNLIRNGQADGISFGGIDGLIVHNNTLERHGLGPIGDDGEIAANRGGMPGIRWLRPSTDVSIADNAATRIENFDADNGVSTGNGAGAAGASTTLADWLTQHTPGIDTGADTGTPDVDYDGIGTAIFVDTESDDEITEISADTEMGMVVTIDAGHPAAGDVAGVRFTLDNGAYVRTEYAVPYAMFGDGGPGSYNPGQMLSEGSHSVGIAYLGADGAVLFSETVGFTVAPAEGTPVDPIPEPEPEPEPVNDFDGIARLAFVDTAADIEITEFGTDTELGLVVAIDQSHPSAGQVEGVQFILDGGVYEHTERHVPYAMFGDSGAGKYKPGQMFTPGDHSVVVNYLGSNGAVLHSQTLNFRIGDPVGYEIHMVDADTEEVLAVFNDIADIDLASADTNIGFVVVPTGDDAESVKSVRFVLNDGAVDRIESAPPFSLFGDQGRGDILGQALTEGDATITVELYSERAGGGEQIGGGTSTVSISYPEPEPEPEPEPQPDYSGVATWDFVDTESDSVVEELDEGTELGLVVTLDPSHPLAANVNAVQFVLDGGAYTHTESMAPLAMFGDSGPGKFNPGEHFTAGVHEVVLNFLGEDGTVLHSETVSFEVEDAPIPEPEPGNAIVVADAAGLAEALATVTGGETIVLKDGHYGTLETGLDFAENVTLRAETPHGAVFETVRLEGASGIDMDGVKITDSYYATKFSSNVALTNSDVSGVIYFRDASFVRVENNSLDCSDMGLLLNETSNFVIRNNYIHDAISDLVRVAGNTYNGVIENNVFDDVTPPDPAPGEARLHPDIFQSIGSSKGTPHDIVIARNIFHDDPNTGDFSGQGLFMSDPSGDGYRNIEIRENLISVGHTNTIVMNSGVEGVVIDSNTMLVKSSTGGSNLRLSVAHGLDNSGVTITNNVVRNIFGEMSTAEIDGNFIVPRGTDLSTLFQNYLGGSNWKDFLPVAGSAIDLSTGLGAAAFLSDLASGADTVGTTWETAEDLANGWSALDTEAMAFIDGDDALALSNMLILISDEDIPDIEVNHAVVEASHPVFEDGNGLKVAEAPVHDLFNM